VAGRPEELDSWSRHTFSCWDLVTMLLVMFRIASSMTSAIAVMIPSACSRLSPSRSSRWTKWCVSKWKSERFVVEVNERVYNDLWIGREREDRRWAVGGVFGMHLVAIKERIEGLWHWRYSEAQPPGNFSKLKQTTCQKTKTKILLEPSLPVLCYL